MIAILLAGGESARTGFDKPTFELNGEMLVERHLRQLRNAGVMEALAVCNPANEASIQTRTGIRTVLQRGHSMSAAVLTGIEDAHAEAVCAVCVNDIVGDCDYNRILGADTGEKAILIPTIPLDRRFPGGYLDLDPATGAVERIVEKPPGGCPAGAAANIMIHQIRGPEILSRLASLLRSGFEYEPAINQLICEGVPVRTVAIRSWVAIKTRSDLARAIAAATQ